MRFDFVLAAAAVVLLASPAAAQERTPERAALLERLGAVLPPSGVTLEDTTASQRGGLTRVEAILVENNPGREADVDTALDHYALCVATGIQDAAPRLVLQAADTSLGDAEIEQLIAFYGGAEHPRFADINARLAAGQPVSDADRAWYQTKVQDGLTQRFAAAILSTGRGFATTPEGEALVSGCAVAFRDELNAARLQGL